MLVSATEMLQKAKAGHYAVGQFNINNLEWTKAILTVAEECKSPVILGLNGQPEAEDKESFQVGNRWFKPNYHAHVVFDWMNHETGKSRKLKLLAGDHP